MAPPAAPSTSPAPRRNAGLALALALVAALTAIAFRGVVELDFVSLDDDRYVTDNAAVRRGLTAAGVRWALTSTENYNWHPLTWLSHMADVSLFGTDPAAHHAVSAVLHAANALLLLIALRALTGALWRSAAVAALFALHPLHVESVAWVSERKDVLSTFFWFLALIAHGHYARRPGTKRLLLVLLPSALGLAAKPMLVTLPFTLLLLDYWPLNRLGAPAARAGILCLLSRRARGLWVEKAPLFLLALASSAVTWHAQSSGGATRSMETFPLAARAANAAVTLVAYLGKTLLPRGLAAYYPFRADIPVLAALGAACLILGATAFALRPRTAPYVATGWLWYLGTLAPVIGIVQVGGQAMADRYTYVPLLGVFAAVAWAARQPPRALLARAAGAIAAAALAVALLVATRRQVATWRSSEDLYRHALSVTTGNWFVEFNYAFDLAQAGRTDEAAEHYRRALAARPGYAKAHLNLGVLLGNQGRTLEALAHFQSALAADPGLSLAHLNLGRALERLGRGREAAAHFREAAREQSGR